MNILSKILNFVKLRQKDVFLIFCMVLIAITGYNLGKINSLKQIPVTINDVEADIYSASKQEGIIKTNNKPAVVDKRVVVSKNSDKYHFTWCSGAKRIKESNKIWFADEAAAQAAGYTKAGNCN